MSELTIEVLSVAQRFEPNADGTPQFLTDILLFPEVTTFTATPEKVRARQLDVIADLLKNRNPDEVARRQLAGAVSPGTVEIVVTPSQQRHGNVWSSPVTLRLPFLRWDHGTDAVIAYVPALGIDIIAPDNERLEKRVPAEVQTAIYREGFANSLLDLAYLQRASELHLASASWNAWPRTPVEVIQSDARGDAPEQGNVLDEIATRLDPRRLPAAYRVEKQVAQLARLLTGKRRTSVLLVGPSGVGKTAVVHELVRNKADHSLASRTFFRSSGSRIVAGMCGFGMWQDRCRQIVRDAPPRKAVLHLGSLLELMQVGQSSASSESIASFLRPFLVRGQLVVIAECTHEQLAVIEKREPKLLDAFRQISLTEPEPDGARDIIRSVAGEKFTLAALEKVDDLHRRYTSDTAYPGRPLRFLSRISPSASSRKLDTTAILGAFAKETGMPQVLLSDDHPLDLGATRDWFCSRISGQENAVSLIIDTLTTIKANLNRPGKPLASFLFIGPTGVGKTELAKVLAEFLYNSRDRMIRLDMSEYNTPLSASRLVSDTGIGGREGLLTAKVREHPFSVILLDEFEKADPAVFDLFLQVLGEARLTDGAGRVADFSNSVIIMTSNLGAREYQRGSLGFASDPARDAVEHFSNAVKAALRPELFNRIDRILPFLPLPRDIIARIIRREFDEIDARDGLGGHGVSLHVEPPVLEHLVSSGYDPRYGARPLKRAIERLLLQPAAELLATSRRTAADLVASLSAEAVISVSWRPRKPSGEKGNPTTRADLDDRARDAAAVRRRLRQLTGSHLISSLNSEVARLTQLQRVASRKKKGGGKSQIRATFTKSDRLRLRTVTSLLERVSAASGAARTYEESLLLLAAGVTLESPQPVPPSGSFDELLIDTFATAESPAPSSTLFITAESAGTLFDLAAAYHQVASGCSLFKYPRKPEKPVIVDGQPTVPPVEVPPSETSSFFSNPTSAIAAIAIGLDTPRETLRFATEPGVHLFVGEKGNKHRAMVGMLETPPAEVALFLENITRPAYEHAPLRRTFDASRPAYRDHVLASRGRKRFSPKLLAELVHASLVARANKAIT